MSGVAGGTPAGGGVCPTGLFPAGVPTGWPHPSADALCPIPAGLGVASGFPVARLLLCSVSPPPPLSAVPSNPFSAAPSESAAGRCWPRLAPAGTRPPRSRPGACVRAFPSRRPMRVFPSAQATGSSRCSVSGHDGDGCRAWGTPGIRASSIPQDGERTRGSVRSSTEAGGASPRAEASTGGLAVARRRPDSGRKRREVCPEGRAPGKPGPTPERRPCAKDAAGGTLASSALLSVV